jgi:hypothetical protein
MTDISSNYLKKNKKTAAGNRKNARKSVKFFLKSVIIGGFST